MDSHLIIVVIVSARRTPLILTRIALSRVMHGFTPDNIPLTT